MGRRVLITGISGQLAGLLARALEQHDDVEYLVGVDVREPSHDLRRTEFVRADIRNPLVTRVMTATEVDTVVHAAVTATPSSAGGRARMKEQNVIGTMQLLAACQKAPSLRTLVVKSSTAAYGSDHTDPALFTEDATPRVPPKGGFAKDVTEIEGYARSLGRRRKDVTVTILRFSNFIGGSIDSLFTRYFSLPVCPTVLGFDPRLQFCHSDDAVAVLEAAALRDHPGIFNVAGPGILYLSQAIRKAGRIPAPVALPFVNLAGGLVRRTGRLDYSTEQLGFLQFGRVGDITKLRDVFGYQPRYSTREALEDHVARRRIRGLAPTEPRVEWDRDLYDFIQRKGQERFTAARASGSERRGEDR
ncbi:MAG TPA: NAD-dependent epimerase/dehydratase family protein [Nitriliruptorales bacterium]|nr:NAD-dependent epimerase/dehydratase family protein [Nitriliruptorales bacterium]